MGFPGHRYNVGQLAGESGRLVEVVDGENLEAGGPDHHLSLVHVGSPLMAPTPFSVEVGGLVGVELDEELRLLGNGHDVAELADQTRRLLELGDG